MQIEKFDRGVVKYLIEESDKALTQALAPLGLKVTRGRSVYDADKLTLKMEITATGTDLEKKEFERWAELLGVKPEDYGREITYGGTRYTLCGLSVTRPKFPFVGKRLRDGAKFKLAAPGVKRALGYTEGAQ